MVAKSKKPFPAVGLPIHGVTTSPLWHERRSDVYVFILRNIGTICRV